MLHAASRFFPNREAGLPLWFVLSLPKGIYRKGVCWRVLVHGSTGSPRTAMVSVSPEFVEGGIETLRYPGDGLFHRAVRGFL